MNITTHRMPSRFDIAMTVAPLVGRGLISSHEGHMLVELRYHIKLAELRREDMEEKARMLEFS